jgi:hypothetical protein
MSPIPQTNTKTRNKARHNHAGIGVCSPNPPQTPAIFLSVAIFLNSARFPQNRFAYYPSITSDKLLGRLFFSRLSELRKPGHTK